MHPLVIDFAGPILTQAERQKLAHPLVGGVILFARNYTDTEQLKRMCAAIKAVRDDVFISVDHEGGRVQRFRRGFTVLPAMGSMTSNELARACGVVMAYELQDHGVDVNFAPVLDRDNGSKVIGDRGFSVEASVITERARALISGLHQLQFPSCAKHFPGHGSVEADSHVACPVDMRSLADIEEDMSPFASLITEQQIDAIMPAHVVYTQCDEHPAGYSSYWLQSILKDRLGFDGVIFSDDLSMEGATLGGSYAQRAIKAYSAGCDYLLLCNAPEAVEPVLQALETHDLRPSPSFIKPVAMSASARESLYQQALEVVQQNSQ